MMMMMMMMIQRCAAALKNQRMIFLMQISSNSSQMEEFVEGLEPNLITEIHVNTEGAVDMYGEGG